MNILLISILAAKVRNCCAKATLFKKCCDYSSSCFTALSGHTGLPFHDCVSSLG